MGVSGCGKSSIGQQLATALSIQFIDADDFHSEEAKQSMASGIPLTDEMRKPWLQRLVKYLTQNPIQHTVMAYSGLRRSHRQIFRELGFKTLFIHLSGTFTTISQRMRAREGHFMPESMLASQFTSLEVPQAEPDIITIDISGDRQQVYTQVFSSTVEHFT